MSTRMNKQTKNCCKLILFIRLLKYENKFLKRWNFEIRFEILRYTAVLFSSPFVDVVWCSSIVTSCPVRVLERATEDQQLQVHFYSKPSTQLIVNLEYSMSRPQLSRSNGRTVKTRIQLAETGWEQLRSPYVILVPRTQPLIWFKTWNQEMISCF